MDSKTTGIVCYITWLGFIIALIMGPKDDFTKQHFNQALILNILGTICSALGGIFAFIPLIRIFTGIAFGLVGLVIFLIAICGIVKAANNDASPLPIIGEFKIIK